MSPNRSDRLLHISLFWQFLLEILVASAIPILLIGYFAHQRFIMEGRQAEAAAVKELDVQATTYLQVRATHTANAIAHFLAGQVHATLAATSVPRTPEAYLALLRDNQGELWYPSGTRAAPREHRERVPLHREIAYIDARGREQVRILDGRVLPPTELRDVSDPANTTYRSETYFADTRALPPGEVYVSHVTAWYTPGAVPSGISPAPEQEVDGAGYGRYEAILRFATPVVNAAGAFDGIVMLTLDYRHVMEDVIHIQPDSTPRQWIVYPDYDSGNYASMFDDEGYLIAHPRLARIRGLDRNGELVPYMTGDMSREEQQKHPLNMKYSAFADPHLLKTYEAVMRGEEGFMVVRNTAGVRRATAYAAIPFAHGVYRKTGIFGGIEVGANLTEFHKPANSVRTRLEAGTQRLQQELVWAGVLAIALGAGMALLVARHITRPLLQLTAAARLMEQGEMDSAALNRLTRRRVSDEVTKLAQVFRQMAEQVQMHLRNLKDQIVELHIKIDEQKKQQQVAEITESDYFQDLRVRAKTLRRGARPDSPAARSDDGPVPGDAPEE
jgi:HAMP domain-containing protein